MSVVDNFMNHKKNNNYKPLKCATEKEKVSHIIDGLKESALTESVHFWMNYPFNEDILTKR